MGNKLCIKRIQTSRSTGNRKRLSFTIEINGTEQTLWFEVEDKWSLFLSTDRCDAAVVSILYYAIRFDYSVKLECPISETLYYHLQYQLIPQLHSTDKELHKIVIQADKLAPKYKFSKNAVGMGMSLGVDSFATLYEYNHTELRELRHRRVTHFTYHQVGAHHGLSRGKQGPNTPQKLFEEDLEKVKCFCRQYNYPLIVITSNLDEVIQDSFPFVGFWASYSFRNAGAALLFQRLFSKYYVSSGFNLNEFRCGALWDSGRYDPVTLPLLSTENLCFYRTNQDWNRIKKIRLLSNFPPSYDHLTICMIHSKNCGTCEKCRPTLLAMDVLGVLERYANSFDIETYRREHRELWLKQLWEEYKRATFIREILEYTLETDYPDLPMPEPTRIENAPVIGTANGVVMRKYPHLCAKILREGVTGKVKILGRFDNWYYVETEQKENGYCWAEYIRR